MINKQYECSYKPDNERVELPLSITCSRNKFGRCFWFKLILGCVLVNKALLIAIKRTDLSLEYKANTHNHSARLFTHTKITTHDTIKELYCSNNFPCLFSSRKLCDLYIHSKLKTASEK